jgi:hypothetical protein
VDVDDEPEALDEEEPLDEAEPEGLDEEDEELMSGSEVGNVRVEDIPSRCGAKTQPKGAHPWRIWRFQQLARESQ